MYYWYLRVDIPHENAKNYWLLKSALKNNTCAQIDLAYSYLTGRIVKQSIPKSKYWLQKAINNKSKNAIYYYALVQMSIENSANDSVIWYLQKASEANIMESNLALSYCYKYGIYCKQNDITASEYLLTFKVLYLKEFLKAKNIIIDSDSFIFYPSGFNISYLISAQIQQIILKLKTNPSCKLNMEVSGQSNYLGQQQSCEKGMFIRNIFIANGVNPNQVRFEYGHLDNESLVKMNLLENINLDEIFSSPPPPPMRNLLNKYFVLNCE